MSDAERRARSEARRARGITVERVDIADPDPLINASIEARLSAMTALCLAAWRATGRPLPKSGRAHRASLPGKLYAPGLERP